MQLGAGPYILSIIFGLINIILGILLIIFGSIRRKDPLFLTIGLVFGIILIITGVLSIFI